MAYLKAMTLAVVAAIALGAGVGARGVLGAGKLTPADKAAVYSQGISEAVYCAVFFSVVLVPSAVVIVFVRRRWRGRGSRA